MPDEITEDNLISSLDSGELAVKKEFPKVALEMVTEVIDLTDDDGEKNGKKKQVTYESKVITWRNGMPAMITYSAYNSAESKTEYIPMKFNDAIYRVQQLSEKWDGKSGIFNHLERAVDQYGKVYILFENRSFTLEEFVKELSVSNSQVDRMHLFKALTTIPLSQRTIRSVEVFKDGDHLKIPSVGEMFTNGELQEMLKQSMRIFRPNTEYPTLESVKTAILKHFKIRRKQITSLQLIAGRITLNVISQFNPLKDYNSIVDAIGDPDTGKSHAIRIALMFLEGIDFSSTGFQPKYDAIKGRFRNAVFDGLTNLAIYVQEADLDAETLKRMKSLGFTIKGHTDQRYDVYKGKTTFILSRNSAQVDLNLNESEANRKRLESIYFGSEDKVTDPKTQSSGDEFEAKILTLGGGYLYEMWETHSITEMIGIYQDLLRRYPLKEVATRFGAWLLDIEPVLEFGIEDEENWRDLLVQYCILAMKGSNQRLKNQDSVKSLVHYTPYKDIRLKPLMIKNFLSDYRDCILKTPAEFDKKYPIKCQTKTHHFGDDGKVHCTLILLTAEEIQEIENIKGWSSVELEDTPEYKESHRLKNDTKLDI